MHNSGKNSQTNHKGLKTRQTAHWDLDYMTMEQRELLIHAIKRDSPKETVNMPYKRLAAELE